jgi:tRNA pseudouridine55 synthase
MTTRRGDGILLVDKPAGMSSHDVVNVARRALGERRIGHAGTLDPFATGLLVVMVGRATRVLPYLQGEPKEYRATIRFGAETDTEDLHGAVTREAVRPTREAVEAALPALTGEIDQVPPAYSAKRVDGRRAYDLARAGTAVELPPVRVRVDAWRADDWRLAGDGTVAELDATVTCGGGTYIRSLARDLARLAGSAAHLVALRRTASGCFRVDDADSIDALREGRVAVRSALDGLPQLARQSLDDADVGRIVRGIAVPATVEGALGALVHAGTGALVAVAERRGDVWQPRVVLREEDAA